MILANNNPSATSNGNISATEAAQHVATEMLLCSFETLQASCTSGQWRRYITGVKSIIKASVLGKYDQDVGFNDLLDWVYYHDVLSRFSLIHRRQQTSPVPPDACIEHPHLVPFLYNATLSLLSDVFDTIFVKLLHTASDEDIDDYKTLKDPRMENKNIPTSDTPLRNNPGTTMVIKLLQLAMLVYFNRASGNLLEPAAEADRRIKGAFTKFSQLGPCERQFPLFISGCEARTDGERCTVLDLIGRTEKMASSRSLFLVRNVIQAIWVQDDLANGDFGYMDKLSAIISCCAVLPTFV